MTCNINYIIVFYLILNFFMYVLIYANEGESILLKEQNKFKQYKENFEEEKKKYEQNLSVKPSNESKITSSNSKNNGNNINELTGVKLANRVNTMCTRDRIKTEGYLGGCYWQVISHKKKVVYFKIPKSASTTIYTSLQKQGFTLHNGYTLPEGYDYSDYCFFTFVREPVERIISAYYTILARGTKKDSDYGKVKDSKEKFKTFVREQYEKPNWLVHGGHELHAMTQLEVLRINTTFKLDFVGRVENIESDWNDLMKVCPSIGPRSTKHANTHQGAITIHPTNTIYYPSGRVCDREACLVLENDPLIVHTINDNFWVDYYCFNYSIHPFY